MTASLTLDSVAALLEHATAAEDVFGHSATDRSIVVRWRELLKIVHPDHHPGATGATLQQCNWCVESLAIWKVEAEDKLKAGTYGDRQRIKTAPVPAPAVGPVTVTVGKRRYATGPVLFEGDIATLYAVDGADEPAILKIARHAGDNDLMEAEQRALRAMAPKDKAKPAHELQLLPQLLDSFHLRGTGAPRRANVLTRHDDHRSLAEVRAAYPDGIDFRDFAWMFRRGLAALGYAHRCGIIHGAILPPHVLIHPDSHAAKIVDWGYSVPDSSKKHIPAIVSAYRAFYPPEVATKGPATKGIDIYMLAKCGIAAMGGDPATGLLPKHVPNPIQAFFQGCILAAPGRRPHDAWVLHVEFTQLLERVVGPRRYRPFAMPARTSS